jgi:hypothetical protein
MIRPSIKGRKGGVAMGEWIKVVTDPLGLAGFALFLMFGYVAKFKRVSEQRWLARVAVISAVAALIGGLSLSYVKTSKSAAAALGQANRVHQVSTGQGSPNVQGVKGDVTITVDQSTGQDKPQEPPDGNSKQK